VSCRPLRRSSPLAPPRASTECRCEPEGLDPSEPRPLVPPSGGGPALGRGFLAHTGAWVARRRSVRPCFSCSAAASAAQLRSTDSATNLLPPSAQPELPSVAQLPHLSFRNAATFAAQHLRNSLSSLRSLASFAAPIPRRSSGSEAYFAVQLPRCGFSGASGIAAAQQLQQLPHLLPRRVRAAIPAHPGCSRRPHARETCPDEVYLLYC
jgi:hypothetical protein